MFKRDEFNIPDLTGIIGGDNSTLGGDKTDQRYSNKYKSAHHYQNHYGHSLVSLTAYGNGNVKFDFVYDIDLVFVNVKTGNSKVTDEIISFLEKVDKNSVMYTRQSNEGFKNLTDKKKQKIIIDLQEKIFKKWL